MRDVVCNTSPLQYLHQLGLLTLLERLARRVWVPSAVVKELEIGRSSGINLPDITLLPWVTERIPECEAALDLVLNLGAGETEVLMLAREIPGTLVVLDDRLARRMAKYMGIPIRGTLGVLLDAKKAGYIPLIKPMLDRLQELQFRMDQKTYSLVLKLAGE
ncbi:MAG: hypothetical protein A2498_15440 [Lentisphaerae bacterium RIFOXYC12_FULL_60_16]|nr:MAG: hypothetical protein A2498_15440 [Lentisphaerae bacterium RIFOXYC12_FULL_60_16]OGV75053.1 MAG: hypothetical protein A2269_00315 [Lentisphaerae bacterium RIFOXYA12_FULL_60_10]OGV77960.1 MAG: hypothetical protein A2340_00335 [Lentisphaerae bacterium RIFOXYB12_FULL_60_10]